MRGVTDNSERCGPDIRTGSGPRSNPDTFGESVCPADVWNVPTYALGDLSKNSPNFENLTLMSNWTWSGHLECELDIKLEKPQLLIM